MDSYDTGNDKQGLYWIENKAFRGSRLAQYGTGSDNWTSWKEPKPDQLWEFEATDSGDYYTIKNAVYGSFLTKTGQANGDWGLYSNSSKKEAHW